MTSRVEKKIRLFCKKGNMDINNLKIIKSDEVYVASDKHMSMMFDEGGKPVSLPLNKPYGAMGIKLGKGLSILYIAVIAGIILFLAIGVIINKFIVQTM